MSDSTPQAPVTELDLVALPRLIADYVRRSGAIGRPRIRDFRARFHGRIRGDADKPWMSFTGQQVNTYSAPSGRLFWMDATMFGLPVDVLHLFVDRSATMHVKVCSLVTMVHASGPDLDRSETVTLFNDLCLLAPAVLVDAAISWEGIDDRHVRGSFTRGEHTVTAELTFDRDGDLIDFSSDDRSALSADGKHSTPRHWSTPVERYRTVDGRRVATAGRARWCAPVPVGDFAYLEYRLDDIAYNVGPHHAPGSPAGDDVGEMPSPARGLFDAGPI